MPLDRFNPRPFLALAVLWFLVSGITASILRFGQLVGMPAGWNYGYLRHGHSHLMYFGWVTPALMALIYRELPALTGQRLPKPRLARWQLTSTGTAAILTFPAFVTSGYGLTRIGATALPLSIITATLNVLTWYVFAGIYWHATRGADRQLPLRALDGAVAFLVLASVGAWGIGVLTATGVRSFFLNSAATHLFLDLFSDGWFVLGTLGLLIAHTERTASDAFSDDLKRGTWLLLAGLPPTFLLGLPVSVVPPVLRFLAGLGGLAVALGLGVIAWSLWKRWPSRPRLISAALVCLGVKAVAEGLLAFPAIARWAAGTQLRVFYLHTLLLGFVTLALVGLISAEYAWHSRLRRWNDGLLVAGVGTTLLALLGITFLAWLPVGPRPLLWLAAAGSVAVLATVAGVFFRAGLAMHSERRLDAAVSHTHVAADTRRGS